MPLYKWKCIVIFLCGLLVMEEAAFAAKSKIPGRRNRISKKKAACPDQLPADKTLMADSDDSLSKWLKNDVPTMENFSVENLEVLVSMVENSFLDRDFQMGSRDYNFLKAISETSFQSSQLGRIIDLVRGVRVGTPEMNLDGASIVKVLEMKDRIQKLKSKIQQFEKNQVVVPAGDGKQMFVYSSRAQEMQRLFDALMGIKMAGPNVPIAGQSRLTLTVAESKLVEQAFLHFINDDEPDLLLIQISIEMAKRDRSGLLEAVLKNEAQKIIAKAIRELQKYRDMKHPSARTLSSVAAEILNLALDERIHPLPVFTEFNLILRSPSPYIAKSIVSLILPPGIPVSFSFHLESVRDSYLSMSEGAAEVFADFVNLLFLGHVGSAMDEFQRLERDLRPGTSRDLMVKILFSNIGSAADELHAFIASHRDLRFVAILSEIVNVQRLIAIRDFARSQGLLVQEAMPTGMLITPRLAEQVVSLYNPDKKPFVQKLLANELLR